MNDETTKKNQQQKTVINKNDNLSVNSTTNTTICSLWAIMLQYLDYITTTTVDNSKNKVDEGNQSKTNRQSKICQLKNQIREQNLLTAQKT